MKLSATTSSIQGLRPYQEDRIVWQPKLTGQHSLACVFDGHVGDAASQFSIGVVGNILKSYLMAGKGEVMALKKTVADIEHQYSGDGYTEKNKEYKKALPDIPGTAGTTAVLGLFDNECDTLTLANVGDSRAVLLRDDYVYQLTMDHSIETLTAKEKRDILATKSGSFRDQYLWTTVPDDKTTYGLNVMRSIGDPLFKARFNPGLIGKDTVDLIPSHPDLYQYDLKSGDTVCFASDGVYNYVNNSYVGKYALQGAKPLVKFALKAGSSDNISAVVVSVK